MPTTSQILKFSPQEVYAAAFTTSGEAGPGKDLGGPLATLIVRKQLEPGVGLDVLAKRPQQFVANDKYTLQQISDPTFGRKIYGTRYDQAVNTFQNPNLMSGYIQATRGATSFRGQAALKYKKPDDIMLDKLGNYYYDSHVQTANDLTQKLGKPVPLGISSGPAPTTPTTTTNTNQQTSQLPGNIINNFYVGANQDDNTKAFLSSFAEKIMNPGVNNNAFENIKQQLISSMFKTPNYLGDDEVYG